MYGPFYIYKFRSMRLDAEKWDRLCIKEEKIAD